MLNDTVFIQASDASGVWRTYSVLNINDSQLRLVTMQSLKTRFPNARIRTINSSGQIIDFLV